MPLVSFCDGGDDRHATSGSVTRASRFLISLMTPFATDDGILAGQVDQGGAGAVIDEASAKKDRLGIEAVWLQLCVVDKQPPCARPRAGLDVVMNQCPPWRFQPCCRFRHI